MTIKRGFQRSRRERPAVSWLSLSPVWTLSTSATVAVPLLQMEAPVLTAAPITSAVPEDLTLLRIVGDFSLSLNTAAQAWTIGLTVQDATWTPGATFSVDADKRILWHMSYQNSVGSLQSWVPPDQGINGALIYQAAREAVHVDISPRVKLENGKALYLVAWENSGAGTLTSSSFDMRLLYSRAKRR